MATLRLVEPTGSSSSGEGVGCVRVAGLLERERSIIVGQYRVIGERQVRDGALPHRQIQLADATGSVTGFIWHDHPMDVEVPPLGSAAEITALVYESNGKPQLKVRGLLPLAWENVEVATDLLLGVPPQLAASLRALEVTLPATLRKFLARVLLDPEISQTFVTCRASGKYHHSERGGLLQHSLENLDLVTTMIERTIPGDRISVGIGRLGYLLHDIGKIRTVGTTQRPPLSWTVRHETHNLLVLAPHLEWLRGADPEVYAALVYVLEYLTTPAKARERARYFPAEAVVMADQCSAASHWRRDLNSFLKQGRGSQAHWRSSPRWRSVAQDRGGAAFGPG